jgi:large subunit ribosomal protein L33
MQSVLKSAAPTVSNPLMGNKMTYRVAAAPVPSMTAFRQVTTMAKKKGVRLIVTIECTESKGVGATPSRYVTQKVSVPGLTLWRRRFCWSTLRRPQILATCGYRWLALRKFSSCQLYLILCLFAVLGKREPTG